MIDNRTVVLLIREYFSAYRFSCKNFDIQMTSPRHEINVNQGQTVLLNSRTENSGYRMVFLRYFHHTLEEWYHLLKKLNRFLKEARHPSE